MEEGWRGPRDVERSRFGGRLVLAQAGRPPGLASIGGLTVVIHDSAAMSSVHTAQRVPQSSMPFALCRPGASSRPLPQHGGGVTRRVCTVPAQPPKRDASEPLGCKQRIETCSIITNLELPRACCAADARAEQPPRQCHAT